MKCTKICATETPLYIDPHAEGYDASRTSSRSIKKCILFIAVYRDLTLDWSEIIIYRLRFN